jgi:hypothetical protein
MVYVKHDEVIIVTEVIMKKLFVLLILSLMGLSNVAVAGSCSSTYHEHDLKKKSDKDA